MTRVRRKISAREHLVRYVQIYYSFGYRSDKLKQIKGNELGKWEMEECR